MDDRTVRRSRVSTLPALAVLLFAFVFVFAGAAACASGGSSLRFQDTLTAAELEPLSEQTVYQFLSSHSQVSIRQIGGREYILVDYQGSMRSLTYGVPRGAKLFVNGREVFEPVPYLKSMQLSTVQNLEILQPTEQSARFGGTGRRSAIVIRTKAEVRG